MRRFLISGGTRGLGLAFCTRYLEQGHAVFTFARSVTAQAEALRQQYPERFTAISADLSNAGVPVSITRAAFDQLGGIDVLINNAAVGQDALLAHLSVEQLAYIVHLNLTCTFLLTRQVLKRMIMQRSGLILNVSSICGVRGFPGLSVYSATKAALDGFTRSLATEVGPLGIRVNAIAPGFFRSDMSAVLSESQVETIERRAPLRVLPTAQGVVQACDILIESDEITGQVLAIDGGASIS